MSSRSFALAEFWKCYNGLPEYIRTLADKKFELFSHEPFHPSLGLQQKAQVWTVDIGRIYRAIALRKDDDFHWFWIGSHEAYNKLLGRLR